MVHKKWLSKSQVQGNLKDDKKYSSDDETIHVSNWFKPLTTENDS